MRMATMLLLLPVVLAASGQVSSIPNITGTWVIVPEASVWRDRLGQPVNLRIFGEGFVAEQKDSTLTIAIDNDDGFVWRYNLDGRESQNVLPLPGGDVSTTSTITVQGNKITITTRSGREGVGRMTNRTIELHADGTARVEAPFGEGGAMIDSVYRRVEDLRHHVPR
jgi:hypothetical protein